MPQEQTKNTQKNLLESFSQDLKFYWNQAQEPP